MDRRDIAVALTAFVGLACGEPNGPSSSDASSDTSSPASSSGPMTAPSEGSTSEPEEVDDSGTSDASSESDTEGMQPETMAMSIENPSFESPPVGPGVFNTTAPPPGWEGHGSLDFGLRTIGVLNPNETTGYTDPVPDGVNVGVVFLQDELPESTEAGLSQTLAATLTANTDYTLQVEVGNLAIIEGDPYDFVGFPGYRVELLAGDEVLASDDNTLAPDEATFETSTVAFSVADTHPQLGAPLQIRLTNLDGDVGIEVNFDDVRLSATSTS